MTKDTENNQQQEGKVERELTILSLVKGKTIDGDDFHAFVAILAKKYNDFVTAQEKGNYNLIDYGEILYADKGHQPSQDIIDKMHDYYGTNMTFEEDFLKDTQKIIKNDAKEKLKAKYTKPKNKKSD